MNQERPLTGGTTTKQFMDLFDTYRELKERFPQGFPFDRNGVRLGIASLEDEVTEVWDEWNMHKRALGNCREQIRTEVLQVAAVALMIVEGIDASCQAPAPGGQDDQG